LRFVWWLPVAGLSGMNCRVAWEIFKRSICRVEFREFHSSALGKRAQYSIYVPPAYDQEPLRQFPVIYFLHGMFNDHTSWAVGRYGNLPLLVENMLLESSLAQFLMVHPNGENSFYTDFLDGTLKYEEYIRLDLIREIEEHFRVKGGRSNRAIAGTSMGGYGALKIALKYSHIYSSAAAGSPIILLGEDPSQQMIHSSSSRAGFFADLFRPVFGIPFDPHHWKNNSVEVLARNRDLEDLNIYIAYGTADRYLRTFPMAEGIQEIHQILTQRGFSHIFRVYEGEPHGWKLLKLHLEEVLEFVTQTFE
jgi:S-formylglutathione hydrolase FrmB